MSSKKNCVDYEKIMTHKIEKEEMEISLLSKRREEIYRVRKKN